MLIPRRVKHRKQHHPGRSGAATGGTKVTFGEYGIQALSPAYVTNRQIESARIAMTRHIKRGGKVWIRRGLRDLCCVSEVPTNLVNPSWKIQVPTITHLFSLPKQHA
jgi:ribosomal protein L16